MWRNIHSSYNQVDYQTPFLQVTLLAYMNKPKFFKRITDADGAGTNSMLLWNTDKDYERKRDLLIQKKMISNKIPLQTEQTHWGTKTKDAMAKAEVPEQDTVSGTIRAPIMNNRHVLVSLSQKEFTGWVLGGPKAWAIAGESDLHGNQGRQITKSALQPGRKPTTCLTASRVGQGGTPH